MLYAPIVFAAQAMLSSVIVAVARTELKLWGERRGERLLTRILNAVDVRIGARRRVIAGRPRVAGEVDTCLLYTSDAADE